MSDWTADKFCQRVMDLGLVEPSQMDEVRRDADLHDPSLDDIVSGCLSKGIMTNLQVDRVLRGERLGFFFGKYKTQYLIGTGTFARVYRASHRETGEVVAIKVLRKRYRESMTETEQFLREGKMGQMLRHGNVAPIYEVVNDPRGPYLVMEFIEGQNLRDLTRVRGKFSPEDAIRIVCDIAAGLTHAAEKGITHRDLKMSNVLITAIGRGKLVDFGLAAAANTDDDEALADCPNARAIDYAALERSTGVRKDDVRSDIFFVGCILYSMLTGAPPLTETKDRVQRLNFGRFRDIVPLTEREPGVPLPLVLFCNRCMDLDPEKRFQNPTALLHEARAASRRLQELREAEARGEVNPKASQVEKPAEPSVSDTEGESRTVLIVESNLQMQDLLRDKLKKRGYRVLITSKPDTVFRRFAEEETVADVVVFCTTELEEQAVEAFNRFGEDELTAETPTLLMVEKERPDLVAAARRGPNRMLLPLPLKVKDLRIALVRLLKTVNEKTS